MTGMLRDLLPAEVVTEIIRGEDPHATALAQEASALGAAVDKRQREFARGRTCARRALRRLGASDAPIMRGPKREPVWPPGIVGSITHCEGFCAASVARASDVWTIGIDAEEHGPLPDGPLAQIALPSERAWLASAPPGLHWDRVLFSAKESVYKAWFPLTHAWLDFMDAEITFDPARGTFDAKLRVPSVTIAGRVIERFAGRFGVHDGVVLTAIAVLAPARANAEL